MSEGTDEEAGEVRRPPAREELARRVEAQEERKLRARRRPEQGIWMGLGMMGLVGWSVAIPTLLFLALGIWLDSRYPSRYSWALMGLAVGVALGCFNAWYWVEREQRAILEEREDDE